jgi:hypothetical protein
VIKEETLATIESVARTVSPTAAVFCANTALELCHELRQLHTLVDATRRLIAALPKCDACGAPATRAHRRGEARFCDHCGPEVREYPRAQPLRDTIAALAALEKP